MITYRRSMWLAVALVLSAVPNAWAQSDQQTHRLHLPAPPTEEYAARGARAAPGVTLGIPSGFGADWGDAAVGFGFQATTRLEDRPDGVAALAFGLGDARKYLGLEVVVSSYGTARTCCRGGASFKLHRSLPGDFGIAAGWENGAVWGGFDIVAEEETDAGSSVYAVASKVFRFNTDTENPYQMVTLTLGVGNGRFRTEDDIIDHVTTANVFGGAAVRFTRWVAAIADYTGQDLAAGISFLPFRNQPLVILPGVADVTTGARFILGAAYGFDYTSWLE